MSRKTLTKPIHILIKEHIKEFSVKFKRVKTMLICLMEEEMGVTYKCNTPTICISEEMFSNTRLVNGKISSETTGGIQNALFVTI